MWHRYLVSLYLGSEQPKNTLGSFDFPWYSRGYAVAQLVEALRCKT